MTNVKQALLALAVSAAWLLATGASAGGSVSCTAGVAPAPSVVTDYETNVTLTGATLHGKVDPHGCVTTYHFEYGTTTAYGSATSPTSAESGTSSVLAAATVTGLAPHTVYHFRIVASSAGGTTDGNNLMFRTKRVCAPRGGSRRPAVVTDDATAVLATSATLHGKVDPHGCPTTYQFEYGTTIAYGRLTQVVEAGSGTRSVLAMANIAGLAPDTVYHFRLVANSGAGTTSGHDERLKTPSGASFVEIARHRAFVKRGFVAQIHLRCALGYLPCQGSLTILLKHHLIGRRRYLLAANSETALSVHLNRRGRSAMRSQRRRRVELIATSASGSARGFVQLIRRFRPS
jgi:hypothetical protein